MTPSWGKGKSGPDCSAVIRPCRACPLRSHRAAGVGDQRKLAWVSTAVNLTFGRGAGVDRDAAIGTCAVTVGCTCCPSWSRYRPPAGPWWQTQPVAPTETDLARIGQVQHDLITGDLTVAGEWITETGLDADPVLVKTLLVHPPRGKGITRLIRKADGAQTNDLQPSVGTHVRRSFATGPSSWAGSKSTAARPAR